MIISEKRIESVREVENYIIVGIIADFVLKERRE